MTCTSHPLECCSNLISQSGERGCHSLNTPIGQYAWSVDLLTIPSEADDMLFTSSECCLDLMPKSEEGVSHSPECHRWHCTRSIYSLNNFSEADEMHYTSSKYWMDIISHSEEGGAHSQSAPLGNMPEQLRYQTTFQMQMACIWEPQSAA
jgi:hypothetical protein